jgi:ferredoxin
MDLTGMKIRSDVCTLCGLCVRFCPVAALTIVGVGMGTPMGAP